MMMMVMMMCGEGARGRRSLKKDPLDLRACVFRRAEYRS